MGVCRIGQNFSLSWWDWVRFMLGLTWVVKIFCGSEQYRSDFPWECAGLDETFYRTGCDCSNYLLWQGEVAIFLAIAGWDWSIFLWVWVGLLKICWSRQYWPTFLQFQSGLVKLSTGVEWIGQTFCCSTERLVRLSIGMGRAGIKPSAGLGGIGQTLCCKGKD